MKFFYYSKNNETIYFGPKFFRVAIFIDKKLIRIKIGNKKYHIGNW